MGRVARRRNIEASDKRKSKTGDDRLKFEVVKRNTRGKVRETGEIEKRSLDEIVLLRH